jgi:hypothetical protein
MFQSEAPKASCVSDLVRAGSCYKIPSRQLLILPIFHFVPVGHINAVSDQLNIIVHQVLFRTSPDVASPLSGKIIGAGVVPRCILCATVAKILYSEI